MSKSILEVVGRRDDGADGRDVADEDEGADDCKVADSFTDADEVVDDDGDAGGVGDAGDAGRVIAGDADGDAVKAAPEGARDDVDDVVGAAASMTESKGMSMK